jgi:hypothetical protein
MRQFRHCREEMQGGDQIEKARSWQGEGEPVELGAQRQQEQGQVQQRLE